jgi:hypothetical protein
MTVFASCFLGVPMDIPSTVHAGIDRFKMIGIHATLDVALVIHIQGAGVTSIKR